MERDQCSEFLWTVTSRDPWTVTRTSGLVIDSDLAQRLIEDCLVLAITAIINLSCIVPTKLGIHDKIINTSTNNKNTVPFWTHNELL